MEKKLYNEAHLDEYIDLLITTGVNLQKGQKLVISCSVECVFFARRAMKAAFDNGAYNVYVRWLDTDCDRMRYLHADNEVFDSYPGWDKLQLETLADENAAFLSISSSDPEAFKGVDAGRLSRYNIATSIATKNYFEKIITSKVRWCIASAPSEKWATKVFPSAKTSDDAITLLWDSIFKACRIGDGNAQKHWQQHKKTLTHRVEQLNKYNFASIYLKNNAGTDLTMKLPKNHRWLSGGDTAKDGIDFFPNIPTEEIFSAPLATGVDGTVVGTMPNIFRGNLIDGFSISFKDGKVVSYDAKVGKEHLSNMITDIPGMDQLGEIALVEHDSPISNMNTLFYNTLYDENASCHLALGSAYPDCIIGGGAMSEDERKSAGINISDSHQDFMFGSADMSIVGETDSGAKMHIFENGKFVL